MEGNRKDLTANGELGSTSPDDGFYLRTFSSRGVLDVCVSKHTKVCREARLRKSKGGIYVYVSRVSWKRRYPDQGKGTYRVRWFLDGTKIGQTITFKR